MAWEEFERAGVRGITGDDPIDEFSLALGRIVRAYQERFGRKPTVHELLHAFESVLTTDPSRYVSDAKGLRLGSLHIEPASADLQEWIDTALYEAVYTDRTDPGRHLIHHRATDTGSQDEVISIPTFDVEDRTLIIEYKILDDSLSDAMTRKLIRVTLLEEYANDYYATEADRIMFVNLATNEKHKEAYTR